jgi:hypothetical protein
MALASVNESHKMHNEDNYKLKPDILSQSEVPISSSPVCLNCNKRKLKSSGLYCSKDCETTHNIIQNLEEEINELKEKEIPFGPNYKTKFPKHNLEILKKELLLLKYQKDVGLIDEETYRTEIALLNYPDLNLELGFGEGSKPILIPLNKGGKTKKTKKTKKIKIKRKWSQKYKKSINCKRPKGFSQKQYCKYGRKK